MKISILLSIVAVAIVAVVSMTASNKPALAVAVDSNGQMYPSLGYCEAVTDGHGNCRVVNMGEYE